MTLYEGAVRRPIMTTLVFIAIAIFGLFSLSKLPIDLMPDIDTNMIMVMETYPGASAEDIENNVTRPLENTLNSVNYLKHITSQSQENYAMITLEFEYGYDIDALTNDGELGAARRCRYAYHLQVLDRHDPDPGAECPG